MLEINDIASLKELIETLEKSRFDFLELETGEIKIKLGSKPSGHPMPSMPYYAPMAPQAAAPIPVASTPPVEKPAEHAGKVVTAPLVGIFYTASAPGNPPFVSAGSPVKKGQVVCIIEAMKIMNEIECEYDGVIDEILVNNGAAVEYGQPLFRVK